MTRIAGAPIKSETRLEVMKLRLRIEKAAIQAVEDSFPGGIEPVKQRRIRDRLAFITVAYAKEAPLDELLGLVRMTRHVYSRTSDVLHGRSNMVNLPGAMLLEWEELVSRVEALQSLKVHPEL
ncbi:hypothetical protein ACTXJX_18930 [Glutamicibacter ardleyensis]|uniref:hypothetical protein n=1 Tax=Glutamicibacter ardleyensis TaxID=225894 RepID=UPI003FD5948D